MDLWYELFYIHMNERNNFAMIAMLLNGKT
jgi:hypothetical protein